MYNVHLNVLLYVFLLLLSLMSFISGNRDLKPTNVLLDENDRPLLMDLGSMNKARIEIRGSREAMTVQVRAENCPAALINKFSANQNIKRINVCTLSLSGLGRSEMHHLVQSTRAL